MQSAALRVQQAEAALAVLTKAQAEAAEREDRNKLLAEVKISEISSLVGRYEAQKQADLKVTVIIFLYL